MHDVQAAELLVCPISSPPSAVMSGTIIMVCSQYLVIK